MLFNISISQAGLTVQLNVASGVDVKQLPVV